MWGQGGRQFTPSENGFAPLENASVSLPLPIPPHPSLAKINLLLEKWLGEQTHSFKTFVFLKLQFCSSFFLCLQGQPELCGSCRFLQSCFSFFVRLHGQPEPFGSCIILQSSSSFFVRLHGQLELFASNHLLQS